MPEAQFQFQQLANPPDPFAIPNVVEIERKVQRSKYVNTEIEKEIKTKKYDTEGTTYIDAEGRTRYAQVNKCNLFVDNIAKKHWGVDLPRIKGTVFDEKYPGWKDRPMFATDMESYMRSKAEFKQSGVDKVTAEEGSKLANKGELVLVLGRGMSHATISAPSKKWPLIYRSDLAHRGKDKRVKVGIKGDKDERFLMFYHINSEDYRLFDQTKKQNNISDNIFVQGFDQDESGQTRWLSDYKNILGGLKEEKK